MYTVSRTCGIPLYMQVVYALRTLITSGDWHKGDRLPSLDELASRFGVARLTIRQAVKCLEHEGVVTSMRGQGIFLARDAQHPPRMTLYTDWQNFLTKSKNTIVHTLTQSVVNGCPLIPEISEKTPFRYWERVHEDNGTPYGYIKFYMEQRIYALAPERFDAEPLLPVAATLPELTASTYRQILTIGTMSGQAAQHLHVAPGSPAANILRTGTLPDGRIFFAAEITYPGSHVQLDIQLQLPHPPPCTIPDAR